MTRFVAPSVKRSDRMVALLEVLDSRGHLSLKALAEHLGVSQATVRRDVAALAAQRLLVRSHGGASPKRGGGEVPVQLRGSHNRNAKTRLAAITASLIPEGKLTVGLTGGTTTAEVVLALGARSDLTIVTNSLSIGLHASEHSRARVLIGGGMLRSSSLELVGQLAEATLRMVTIDTAVVGADGVSIAGGLTTHDETEARINRTMIERARRVILVVDHTKIGRRTAAHIADLSEIDVLVTDAAADEPELSRIRAAGVDVRVVAAAREPEPRQG